jgi:hypothetical protein
MTSSSSAPVVCRSAWIDGAATFAMVASACAMKGAMSRTASSRFRWVRVVRVEAMPMRRATRPGS